ncbi:hypothetical protein EYF80_001734 [Liparis tanakae]|uniref:Uncharacterized protein n=1 Tax=Liparis tanakae TaxID=230148 RepID=A0A4Z2JEF3_9TELE|nr:hypothetical protein EYF80_001734 [Liparis tanakae]
MLSMYECRAHAAHRRMWKDTASWTRSILKHWVQYFSDFWALGNHSNHPPGPAKPLGQVGGPIRGPVVTRNTLPSKAQGHVGVQVERLGGGRVELDDVREADFVGSGGHEYVEALETCEPDATAPPRPPSIRSADRHTVVNTLTAGDMFSPDSTRTHFTKHVLLCCP